jgi:hypothetical protein
VVSLPADGAAVPAEALDGSASGVHGLEHASSVPFRWTEPVVVLDIKPPPNARAVTLQLVPGLTEFRAGDIAAAWGRHCVDPAGIRTSAGAISVNVSGRGPLTIAVTRFRAHRDPRRLGLPLTAVAAEA